MAWVRRIVSDADILAHRARVEREEDEERFTVKKAEIALSPTGCSSPGAERWDGYGWTYCPRGSHCRAEATQIEIEKRRRRKDSNASTAT